MKSVIFMALPFLLWGGCVAYVYDIAIFAKELRPGRMQHVVFCSDWHDRAASVSLNQNKMINTMLRGCNKQRTAVVVEDLSSNAHGGAAYCGRFPVDSRGGLLGGLAQDCKTAGVEVANIEFRQCRVLTVSPEIGKMPGCGINGAATTVQTSALVNEIKEVIKRVGTYSDGVLAKNCYADSIKKVVNHTQYCFLQKEEKGSVAQLLKKSGGIAQQELCKQLLTFDGSLLEMQLLHAILGYKDKEVVVVFAGGTHCSVVADLLGQFGYRPQQRTQTRIAYEKDAKKCDASWAMQGNVFLKPVVVDLALLERFLT